MAKKDKKVGAVVEKTEKKKEVVLFYVNKDKYQRAVKQATKPSEVKKIYEKLGGLFAEGTGYMRV